MRLFVVIIYLLCKTALTIYNNKTEKKKNRKSNTKTFI